ncbi:hypothetical protein MRX96_016217 [Rhipicephalus microplus]
MSSLRSTSVEVETVLFLPEATETAGVVSLQTGSQLQRAAAGFLNTQGTSGNFESQRRQRKEDVRQVARQETPETLFRDMCPSQFDTIELDQTDDPADLCPAPAVSVECSPSLLEPGMSYLEAMQSRVQPCQMSVMQPPKKRQKKDDNDSLLVEHLGKLTNSLEDQDDHHYFALSLVKSMRKVKEEDYLRMRMKILEVIQQFNSS